jgi:putative selenium metabolism hydrolase
MSQVNWTSGGVGINKDTSRRWRSATRQAQTTVSPDEPNEIEMIDYAAVLRRARRYEKPMARLLRELVAIPSESRHEGKVITRIRRELHALSICDRIWVDRFGNLLAQIGKGGRLLAIDAHVDTVGLGDREAWPHDPYKGKVAAGIIYGRGAGDQKGAVPAMLYAARIIKELQLCSGNWSLLLTFTVSEEDCDGLSWQHIVREDRIRPDCVLVTDSTNCKIMRGQRGRMEIGIAVRGRSCHAAMPHKGDNAVYKIARIISEIEKLNDCLRSDEFLGKGTVTVSYVNCRTPSLCAVPDRAYVHLDRRLTAGETRASALRAVRAAVRRAGVRATIQVATYDKPTYTGLVYPAEKYFPTWWAPADAPQVRAAVATYRSLFRRRPLVDRWTFSTNAVSIAGIFRIPCVGFGPAVERVAHTVTDSVPIEHLVRCAAFYAAFPQTYCEDVVESSAAPPV